MSHNKCGYCGTPKSDTASCPQCGAPYSEEHPHQSLHQVKTQTIQVVPSTPEPTTPTTRKIPWLIRALLVTIWLPTLWYVFDAVEVLAQAYTWIWVSTLKPMWEFAANTPGPWVIITMILASIMTLIIVAVVVFLTNLLAAGWFQPLMLAFNNFGLGLDGVEWWFPVAGFIPHFWIFSGALSLAIFLIALGGPIW